MSFFFVAWNLIDENYKYEEIRSILNMLKNRDKIDEVFKKRGISKWKLT